MKEQKNKTEFVKLRLVFIVSNIPSNLANCHSISTMKGSQILEIPQFNSVDASKTFVYTMIGFHINHFDVCDRHKVFFDFCDIVVGHENLFDVKQVAERFTFEEIKPIPTQVDNFQVLSVSKHAS